MTVNTHSKDLALTMATLGAVMSLNTSALPAKAEIDPTMLTSIPKQELVMQTPAQDTFQPVIDVGINDDSLNDKTEEETLSDVKNEKVSTYAKYFGGVAAGAFAVGATVYYIANKDKEGVDKEKLTKEAIKVGLMTAVVSPILPLLTPVCAGGACGLAAPWLYSLLNGMMGGKLGDVIAKIRQKQDQEPPPTPTNTPSPEKNNDPPQNI